MDPWVVPLWTGRPDIQVLENESVGVVTFLWRINSLRAETNLGLFCSSLPKCRVRYLEWECGGWENPAIVSFEIKSSRLFFILVLRPV